MGGVAGRLPLLRKEGEGLWEVEWFKSSLRAWGGIFAARLRSVSGGPNVEDLVRPGVRSNCRGALGG